MNMSFYRVLEDSDLEYALVEWGCDTDSARTLVAHRATDLGWSRCEEWIVDLGEVSR